MQYLLSVIKQFLYYKELGEKTFTQLSDEALFTVYNEESNSIAMIVQHLSGNMISRWTEFLTEDGEKPWRNRDEEFSNKIETREELVQIWEKGWFCLLDALNNLSENDLDKIIYIRNQGHTVLEAINRQLAHYPYHVGQIVYIGKMYQKQGWQSLSIPKGGSNVYNSNLFAEPKKRKRFTDK